MPRFQWAVPPGERMQQRNAPPGRMSMSQCVVTKPCGPHQRATCSGSVHALNTRVLGASMMRVTTSSRSAVLVATLLPAPMALLLLLQFAQMVFQTIETLLPEFAVLLQPVG